MVEAVPSYMVAGAVSDCVGFISPMHLPLATVLILKKQQSQTFPREIYLIQHTSNISITSSFQSTHFYEQSPTQSPQWIKAWGQLPDE